MNRRSHNLFSLLFLFASLLVSMAGASVPEDGTDDRARYYWNLQGIDRRIGFVDIDHDAGTEEWYYYITDHANSVVGVVDANGNLVNHYDYDAYGNLLPEHSFENVPNRYRFQGREYDAHRGDYYYRHRTYVPAWGSFTGPDPVIDLYNPRGVANYLFCRNNPLVYMDPYGLDPLRSCGVSPAF
jgi:RHS repeat-associated protein